MSEIVIRGFKIGITVVSVVTTVASSYIAGKELDAKITKKVAEALSKRV